jgi:putative nucleotidyltransferase with HDIG domain
MLNKKIHLKRLMFSIASLIDLGQEATSSKDLMAKMKAALYVITGTFSVPTAALFVYKSPGKRLDLLVEKGHRDRAQQKIRLGVSGAQINKFRMNEPHTVGDMAENDFFRQHKAEFSRLHINIFLPLFAKDEFIGAITLGRKLGGAPYRQGEKDVLRVIAHQMAITLHNSQLFMELAKKAAENKRLYTNMQRIYNDTIQAFAAAIDAKDEYTKDHSYRVANYAVAIAKELGWKKKDTEGIYVAGLLHDIGKIIIDTEVIKKGEKLTASEISEIKKHPEVSYEILSKVKFPWKNIDYFVRHHHERMDGKGYPDALASAELSDGVKILALADAFDAMTTDRPYRLKLGLDEAFCEVLRCCDTQFDERIIKTFFNLLLRELSGEINKPQILPHLGKPEEALYEISALPVPAM